MLQRAVLGFFAAMFIALVARRTGSLSRSGAVAATLLGAGCAAAGYAWAALLIVYFVASVALSRFGRTAREARTASVIAKGGARDATQVLANGGVFAALALLSTSDATLAVAALGALAASAADTWATEIGTLYGGTPRSILGGKAVSAGMSGGMTLAGSAAMIVGALFVAIVAAMLSLPRAIAIVAGAGIAGAMTDTLLGATLQERRWCASCEQFSERAVHDCGEPTTQSGGLAWMNNDVVNVFATLAGGTAGALLAL